MTVATPLFERLAAAYVRGVARSLPEMAVDPALLDAPLDALGDAGLAALVQLGQAHGLRLHRFKRTMGLPRVRLVYLEAPLAQVLRRNRQRQSPVPEAVIRRLAARVEPPDLTEAHRLTIVEG